MTGAFGICDGVRGVRGVAQTREGTGEEGGRVDEGRVGEEGVDAENLELRRSCEGPSRRFERRGVVGEQFGD